MESHGAPGRIHISQATHELIKDDFVCDHRGTIEVKGKGHMDTWFVEATTGSPS
jgi:class 3 adenylate cyclase